ncbi:MAG: DUF721 domain-containing protein [Synergistaceae bacterium]|nr:DUF721 domain-containing protein [Synergistaceae bacterium]
MPDEEEKIFIDLEALYPEAARRVKILEALQKSWASVVSPALARHSFPYNLGVNEIAVAVDGAQAANMLKNMKGNILRVLSARFEYKPGEKFNLKITNGIPERRPRTSPLPYQHTDITINEDELREQMNGAPKTLPEEINRAISSLKIFLDKRFSI